MIHTADLHFGVSNNSVPSDSGIPSQIVDTQLRFVEMIEAAHGGDHHLIIAGDLWDTVSPKAYVIEAVFACFKYAQDRGVRITLLPGNHDCDLRWSALIIAKGANFDNVSVIEEPSSTSVMGLLPHMPRKHAEAWLKEHGSYSSFFLKSKAKPWLLVSHGTVAGATNSSEIEVEAGNALEIRPEKLPPEMTTILLGHIHLNQEIKFGKRTVVYSGSPTLVDFSEVRDTKGYYDIDLTTRDRKFVAFRSAKGVRRYREIIVDLISKDKFVPSREKLEKLRDVLLKVVVLAKDLSQIDEQQITGIFNEYGTVVRFDYEIQARSGKAAIKSSEVVFAGLNHAELLEAWIDEKSSASERVKKAAMKVGLEAIESCLLNE